MNAQFSNITATPPPFCLLGGRFMLTAIAATWGSGLQLNQLASDGTTYVKVMPAAGANPLAANGQILFDLPVGTFQIALAGSFTGCFVDLTETRNCE